MIPHQIYRCNGAGWHHMNSADGKSHLDIDLLPAANAAEENSSLQLRFQRSYRKSCWSLDMRCYGTASIKNMTERYMCAATPYQEAAQKSAVRAIMARSDILSDLPRPASPWHMPVWTPATTSGGCTVTLPT